MSDVHDRVMRKVSEIFSGLVGDRAKRLDASAVSTPAMDALKNALAANYGRKAADIAVHLADWNFEAAFIVALHLYPERFTADEIEAGVGLFLVHVPNHIREACRLTGTYVWRDFPEDT